MDPLIDLKCDELFTAINRVAKPLTLTSIERQYALYEAVRYVSLSKITGDIVECGVWKGGSMLIAAHTLAGLGDTDRTLWLYDTFEGMTPPGAADVPVAGIGADHFYKAPKLRAGVNEAKATMALSGYPEDRIDYIVGDVRDSLQVMRPKSIALLRLDTDWYDSTKVELEALYDLVVPGGVVLFDDYGHWLGSKQAIDEFFASRGEHPLLHRMDYSGRVMVKR